MAAEAAAAAKAAAVAAFARLPPTIKDMIEGKEDKEVNASSKTKGGENAPLR
jgi:hypothetical protein